MAPKDRLHPDAIHSSSPFENGIGHNYSFVSAPRHQLVV